MKEREAGLVQEANLSTQLVLLDAAMGPTDEGFLERFQTDQPGDLAPSVSIKSLVIKGNRLKTLILSTSTSS